MSGRRLGRFAEAGPRLGEEQTMVLTMHSPALGGDISITYAKPSADATILETVLHNNVRDVRGVDGNRMFGTSSERAIGEMALEAFRRDGHYEILHGGENGELPELTPYVWVARDLRNDTIFAFVGSRPASEFELNSIRELFVRRSGIDMEEFMEQGGLTYLEHGDWDGRFRYGYYFRKGEPTSMLERIAEGLYVTVFGIDTRTIVEGEEKIAAIQEILSGLRLGYEVGQIPSEGSENLWFVRSGTTTYIFDGLEPVREGSEKYARAMMAFR